MCGIVGVISGNTIDFSIIKEMTDVLFHRGPDAEGFLISRTGITGEPTECNITGSSVPFAFGHRRLAIIDLSSEGIQPMSYRDRYWIIYNGEIYNYLELRKQLVGLGHEFKTNTDTEVILAAYSEWGNGCLAEFNGMWAFAIYDSKEGKIFLSRDRFGIKPLYYYKSNESFIFASEIKAILKHPEIKLSVNENYCREFYKNGGMEFITETAFENVLRFSPGCFCEIELNKLFIEGIDEKKYWSLPGKQKSYSCTEDELRKHIETFRDLLTDSVNLRLRSDVDIGVTLSGGLDSSSIAYLCRNKVNKYSKTSVETFSSIYEKKEEKYCDESEYIEALSNHLGIKNNKICPDVDQFRKSHREMIYAMDSPPDSTCMAGWYTYKKLGNSHIKVNLEGQGADELLAGYRRYITKYYASGDIHVIFSAVRNIFTFKHLAKNIFFGVILNLLKRFLPVQAVKRIVVIVGYREDPYISVEQSMLCDISGELVNLLKYADSESMYNSVETRFPYLDYRLVEFLSDIPVSCKIYNGWSKYIARVTFEKKLPDKIVWRKDKMGWPVPEKYWLREIHFDWIREKLMSSVFLKKLIGEAEIKRVLGKKSEINLLTRLLNLAVWHEIFVEKKPV